MNEADQDTLLLMGCALLVLIYTLGRLHYIIGSDKVEGRFVFYVTEDSKVFPIIEYLTTDSIVQFRGQEGTQYEADEKVPVLLLRKDTEQPMLYSISSFWLQPLVLYLLPLALWAAFMYSYVSKYETVITISHFPFFKKVRTKDLKKDRSQNEK